MIYNFERQARQVSSVLLLGAIWILFGWLWLSLDASLWIISLLTLFTLPLLWDLIRNSTATLEVWPNRLVWTSAISNGDHSDIDHLRMDRRFSGTMRITIVHVGGAQTRLPPDLRPPLGPLEQALGDAGIAVQKHPFSLL